MPSVLGVPLPFPSNTVTHATSPELLLALVNTLIWALIALLLSIQILENRRIGAHLAQQLANKRRVNEELIRKARERRTLRERRLEQIPEGDEVEEVHDEGGFEVVPGRRPVVRNGVLVEQDLRKAMGEEILEPDAEDDRRFETLEEDEDLREAMVDEFLERREGRDIEHREGLGKDGDSDDGLEMVRVPTRGLPDREGSPFGRW